MMSQQNEKWIFVIGLARGSESWKSFPNQFQRTFPNTEIEFYEFAGNGERVSEASALSIDHYVEDLRLQSQFLKNHGALNVMSISMGSMVSVRWAELYPSEVKQIVVMNASCGALSPFYERVRIFDIVSVYRMYKDGLPKAPHQSRPVTRWPNILRQAFAASRFQFPKQPPIQNIKLFASENDNFVHPKCMHAIGRQWQLPVEVIPNATHDLMGDNPEDFLRRLQSLSQQNKTLSETQPFK